MEYEIVKDYGQVTAHEISVDFDGYNFRVIYGEHTGGWFIAVPNWELCVEATFPTDHFYNTEKLSRVFNNAERGKAVAEAIKEHWETLRRR